MRANHSFGDAVRLIERRDARSGHRQRVAIYCCFVCEGYHVGRPSKRGQGAA